MKNRISKLTGLAVLTAVALLVPTGTAVALPDPQVRAVNTTADLVADAAPADVQSAIPQGRIQDTVVLASADSAVTIPQDAHDGISFIDPTTEKDDSVVLGLPVDAGHRDAAVAKDGTAVYADASGGVDVAVQATATNVRVSTVIRNADAPTTFTYDVDGASPVLLPDGGVELRQDVELVLPDGSTVVQNVAGVTADAPWAKDADGKDVPTHYEVRGNAVVQVVETSADTAFPVVADPNWFKIAKCAAAVAYVAFTAAFVVGKSVAIVRAVKAGIKFVKAVGGPRAAAKLIVGASTAKERTAFFARARSIAGASVLDFLGISTIKNNCF